MATVGTLRFASVTGDDGAVMPAGQQPGFGSTARIPFTAMRLLPRSQKAGASAMLDLTALRWQLICLWGHWR